jgi:hypothetical protein
VQRRTRRRELPGNVSEVGSVVGVTAIGRALPARHQVRPAQLAEVDETRFCGSSTRPHNSRAVRSLRASSPNSRHRSGCLASRKNSGGPEALTSRKMLTHHEYINSV